MPLRNVPPNKAHATSRSSRLHCCPFNQTVSQLTTQLSTHQQSTRHTPHAGTKATEEPSYKQWTKSSGAQIEDRGNTSVSVRLCMCVSRCLQPLCQSLCVCVKFCENQRQRGNAKCLLYGKQEEMLEPWSYASGPRGIFLHCCVLLIPKQCCLYTEKNVNMLSIGIGCIVTNLDVSQMWIQNGYSIELLLKKIMRR